MSYTVAKRGTSENQDEYPPAEDDVTAVWEAPKSASGSIDEEYLLARASIGSGRLSGCRLSTTEFENVPHKDVSEINEAEAEKWLNPYAEQNRCIFASYFAVGIGLFFIQTPVAFYMVDTLGATPAQQSVITGLMSLPWALKILCGFLSDSLPIFADVCTDAMIVERSKLYEHAGNQGTLQATGYIIRFFGSIIGATLGAILYNKSSFGWGVPIWGIWVINASIPILFIFPFFSTLVEVELEEPPKLKAQIQSIWELVQQKAVWQPCSFIYIYNVLLVTNPAWNSFLVSGLDFSNFDIGLLTLAGAVLSYIALVVYKRYLFDVSWRRVYLFSSGVGLLFACLQLVLVLQSTKLGGPAVQLLFAMGSYGMIMFVQAIQFLPACRMFLGMCPEGAEGASYAMLTTLSNLAGTVAYSIAAAMANIWDVSIDTLSRHEYSGMWKLTLLCGCVQLVGLFFIKLLPSGVAEQLAMQSQSIASKNAGAAFLVVVFSSLSYVVVYTLVTILDPSAVSSDDGA
eukprot:GSChrysophyteH1.ASY1.ANO1.2716.1 assembled CDS